MYCGINSYWYICPSYFKYDNTLKQYKNKQENKQLNKMVQHLQKGKIKVSEP